MSERNRWEFRVVCADGVPRVCRTGDRTRRVHRDYANAERIRDLMDEKAPCGPHRVQGRRVPSWADVDDQGQVSR